MQGGIIGSLHTVVGFMDPKPGAAKFRRLALAQVLEGFSRSGLTFGLLNCPFRLFGQECFNVVFPSFGVCCCFFRMVEFVSTLIRGRYIGWEIIH